jgi:hypothetical protein
MQSTRSQQSRLRVAIVSKNPETLDGLETYLRRAGVTTNCTRDIGRSAQIGSDVAAIVVFPDDFEWDDVVSALAAFARTNPRALPVVVTSAPQRFEALSVPEGVAPPLLVPKPAWGWTILDAIRAHLRESEEESST